MIKPNILPDEEFDELQGTILTADMFREKLVAREDVFEVEEKKRQYQIIGLSFLVGMLIITVLATDDIARYNKDFATKYFNPHKVKLSDIEVSFPNSLIPKQRPVRIVLPGCRKGFWVDNDSLRYHQLEPIYPYLDYPFMYYSQFPLPKLRDYSLENSEARQAKSTKQCLCDPHFYDVSKAEQNRAHIDTGRTQYKEKWLFPSTLTSKSIVYGNRTKTSIMRGVRQNLGNLRHTYSMHRKEKPGDDGTMKVEWAIDEFGKVLYAKVISSTIDDLELKHIVMREIKTWKFEKINESGDITKVVYPFVFKS